MDIFDQGCVAIFSNQHCNDVNKNVEIRIVDNNRHLTSAAWRRARLALCSPSAAITFEFSIEIIIITIIIQVP